MHAFPSRQTLPWGREFKTTRDLKGLNRMNDWTVETPAWRKGRFPSLHATNSARHLSAYQNKLSGSSLSRRCQLKKGAA